MSGWPGVEAACLPGCQPCYPASLKDPICEKVFLRSSLPVSRRVRALLWDPLQRVDLRLHHCAPGTDPGGIGMACKGRS